MSCSSGMYKFKPVYDGCVEVLFLQVCYVSRSVRQKSGGNSRELKHDGIERPEIFLVFYDRTPEQTYGLYGTRVPWYAELKITTLYEVEIFAVHRLLTSMISRWLQSHAEKPRYRCRLTNDMKFNICHLFTSLWRVSHLSANTIFKPYGSFELSIVLPKTV